MTRFGCIKSLVSFLFTQNKWNIPIYIPRARKWCRHQLASRMLYAVIVYFTINSNMMGNRVFRSPAWFGHWTISSSVSVLLRREFMSIFSVRLVIIISCAVHVLGIHTCKGPKAVNEVTPSTPIRVTHECLYLIGRLDSDILWPCPVPRCSNRGYWHKVSNGNCVSCRTDQGVIHINTCV